MTRTIRGVLLVAVMLAFTAGTAFAQSNGSISGKVTDASGGVLPGVTVTVSGPSLLAPLVGVTQASGSYQFPIVAIGTVTVTFELTGFKKVSRSGVVITTNFNAQIDQKMEIGGVTQEITVTAAAPVVDVKKTNTGGTFTKDVLENIPTARDPWQVVAMAPGVQTTGGVNVGGSASGQQLTLSSRGTSANVQWNLEGGSITDVASNGSPAYFNFDSFEQIQVVTGGGDVSVQSSGLSINLTTKSGSNVFKGTGTFTFENSAMQSNNVTQALFNQSGTGFLSGNPLKKIDVVNAEYGGPIMKNKLWFWGAYDRQEIIVGDNNFFDPTLGSFCAQLSAAQANGTTSTLATYSQLSAVKACLHNDSTLIKDAEWKINYQLNASNKFQWLMSSDNKIRNSRSASANSAVNSTWQQFSPPSMFGLGDPTNSITHTWIASDKLVFNNQYTHVVNSFNLDNQDFASCGKTTWQPNASSFAAYGITGAGCLFNTNYMYNATSGYSLTLPYTEAIVRPTNELKTDGTYFISKFLGGDHSLKFGIGYRDAVTNTYVHYDGGGYAYEHCPNNTVANCSTSYIGQSPAAGTLGQSPYQAYMRRDAVTNIKWWTFAGYIQDQYSRGKLRLNGGVRYDWQTSKFLGGCTPANPIVPTTLPGQCYAATNIDPNTGKVIPAFGNLGPRVSATYDLQGNGKTSIHASGAYYYATRITLANGLSGLGAVSANWGPNNTNTGACSTATGIGCWTDANKDGMVQANELVGSPTSTSSGFNILNGTVTPVGNFIGSPAQIARTREVVVGMSHELMANFAVSVDYTYRNYDRGTSTYSVGFTPYTTGANAGGMTILSSLYTGPLSYTDPITGKTGTYYVYCSTCVKPSATAGAPLANISLTSPNYSLYHGVDITANKRFSNKWQMNFAVTLQNAPGYTNFVGSPTGLQYTQGISTLARYVIKGNGSYQLPWGVTVSANLNYYDGATRSESINGPGSVPGSGGVNYLGVTQSALSFTTLAFQPANAVRYAPTKLLDMGAQKVFSFRGGKNRVTLMLDAFNIFNSNTIQSYNTNNISLSTNTSPTSLIAPRVFRIGAKIAF
jgi:hypothetical protein